MSSIITVCDIDPVDKVQAEAGGRKIRVSMKEFACRMTYGNWIVSADKIQAAQW